MLTLTYYTDGKRHIVCKPYSIEGLHTMAADLGLRRCWFHNNRHPHYDIPVRRREEIESRCVLVTSKELFNIIHS